MVTLETLQRRQQAVARAEFEQWNSMLQLRDLEFAKLEADTPALTKRLARSAVVTDIATALHLPESRAWRMLEDGDRVRHEAPTVWIAFSEGQVRGEHVRLISDALATLTTDEAKATLDENVVDYATSHTPGELKSWLKRFLANVEPEQFIERCEKAREARRVEIIHDDNGMSWLNAYLPTIVATAIGNRLRKAAKALDDPRTRDQKKADLLAHWMTCSTGTQTEIHAEIAVTVPAEALGNHADAALLTEDGEVATAAWVAELLETGHDFWTRLLTSPSGEVLDRTSLGYQPPESLRKALQWRDGTCRVKGCAQKARNCDLDHVIPFDAGGRTTAANLRSLCRKHHGMKGHGRLRDTLYDDPAHLRERYRRVPLLHYWLHQEVQHVDVPIDSPSD